METQLGAQNVVPKRLGWRHVAEACSFTEALKIIKSTEDEGLTFQGLFDVSKEEKNSLKLLPEAFRLNRRLQKLTFHRFTMADSLVAEAFKAGLRRDNVTFISFTHCNRKTSETLMETMCEGLKERSAPFELEINDCSEVFAKPIIEASYLKCFSLWILGLNYSSIKRPMKKLISKANLYYITLASVRDLEKNDFLQLGRCLLPNLIELNLEGTLVPASALKRLYRFLKVILDSGRSNAFELLDLGATTIDSKLTFAYFRLLRFDIIGMFGLNVEQDISRAVVKNICSTVAKTKNLRTLTTGSRISSGTGFETISLQNENSTDRTFWYKAPFHVIPPVV